MPPIIIYAAAGMLILGAAPLPYGYYMLLRLVACAVFIAAAVVSHNKGNKLLPWAFGFAALLFNPLIKVHLPKEAWAVVDVLAGVALIATKRQIGGASR